MSLQPRVIDILVLLCGAYFNITRCQWSEYLLWDGGSNFAGIWTPVQIWRRGRWFGWLVDDDMMLARSLSQFHAPRLRRPAVKTVDRQVGQRILLRPDNVVCRTVMRAFKRRTVWTFETKPETTCGLFQFFCFGFSIPSRCMCLTERDLRDVNRRFFSYFSASATKRMFEVLKEYDACKKCTEVNSSRLFRCRRARRKQVGGLVYCVCMER